MTHIALIDSGIGGFSVLAEIEAAMPEVTISYFMDNLYLPYGELSEAELLQRLESIVAFLLDQSELDIIVIACNTASTQSLDFLRQRFNHTFVGVVPAIKPAALASRSGCIGLLATPATVQGAYSHQLIDDFAEHCTVQRVGSSELVHLAETLFWQPQSGQQIDDEVSQNIRQITNGFAQVDTIVLGCTHFPLIKQVIQQVLGDEVLLVDSGEAIAKRVCSLLGPLATVECGQIERKLLFSTQSLSADKLNKLAEMGFARIEHVQL
ncbi:MAG: glutamate racemase [Phenylobacterium sp.]|jgi:glutamate racemase